MAMYPLDDAFFSDIDSDLKAYALGLFASDGVIREDAVALFVPREETAVITALGDAICPELPLRPKKEPPRVALVFSSRQMVSDVRRWLALDRETVDFPPLSSDALKWSFLRGYVDGGGEVSPRGHVKEPYCAIASASPKLLEAIASFSAIPCRREPDRVAWTGNNALDLLARLYDGAPIAMQRKRRSYEDWATWVSRDLLFRWVKVHPAARPPTKAHASDSGYDITLIEAGRRAGMVQFYRTGLKLQPSFGWYFDLVPRSSITKTGYIVANSVGVIDRTYVGEVLVPLIKIDPSAPDLELPARVAQIIPRPIVHAAFVEVESLDESLRGSGGFGSTGHR